MIKEEKPLIKPSYKTIFNLGILLGSSEIDNFEKQS